MTGLRQNARQVSGPMPCARRLDGIFARVLVIAIEIFGRALVQAASIASTTWSEARPPWSVIYCDKSFELRGEEPSRRCFWVGVPFAGVVPTEGAVSLETEVARMPKGRWKRAQEMRTGFEVFKFGVVTISVALVGALPAYAGVGLAMAPTYPTMVNVGQSSVPVTLTITNGATGVEIAEELNISNIQHTPACGASGIPCANGNKDPGVFQINTPATGSAGSCAGMMFNVAISDASTGTVTFTPQSGSVVLDPKGTPNDFCTISFTVNVLKLPVHDAGAGPGVMTNQLASAQAQAAVSSTVGSGTGVSQTTVVPPREQCESCLRSAPTIGVTGSVALALLLVGGGLRALRRRGATRV